jgi:hypothetical protein
MRRWVRFTGTVLIALGVLTLVWAAVVWQWQDPFTALYTTWRQHQLTSQYEKRVKRSARRRSRTSRSPGSAAALPGRRIATGPPPNEATPSDGSRSRAWA